MARKAGNKEMIMRKRMSKHGIAIIGVAVLIFLSVASAPSASAASKSSAKDAFNKGNEHYNNKNYDQAITEYAEAIRLDPKYKAAYYNRGLSYYNKGDYDHAIADFDKYIQLDPKDKGAYYNRGRSYHDKKDYDHAIADYDKCIQLDPSYASAYNQRAWIYAYNLKRDFGRALSDANQALKLKPDNASYLDTRGWAYLGNGNYENAIIDFEAALKISPNMQSAIDGLAMAEEKAYVQSDEDFEIKQNADNTLTITGYKGKTRNVVIPATLYGLKVTVIGGRAFRKSNITSLVIPDTVTSIEHGEIHNVVYTDYYGAFSNNLALTKVILGKGLRTIGNCAFSRTGITEIIIPDSVTIIGDAAFGWTSYDPDDGWRQKSGDSKLVKVALGKGLQSIGKYAFLDNQITELNLPASLKEIKDGSFEGNKIQKITFSTGLEIIGSRAFSNNQITELELPSSLKEIKNYTFADNQIQKIAFGTRLEIIGIWAFSNNQITELTTLPSSLKEIRGGAFQKNQMRTVIIPDGVTSIKNGVEDGYAEGAFANNPLTTVVIPLSLSKAGIDIRAGYGDSQPGLPFGKISGSKITSITIPVGMDEKTLKAIFEEAFVNFWINQNKAGGTYVKRGPIWTKE
jgi:tetratricopeptide (TPR) repeat protein